MAHRQPDSSSVVPQSRNHLMQTSSASKLRQYGSSDKHLCLLVLVPFLLLTELVSRKARLANTHVRAAWLQVTCLGLLQVR